MKPLQTETPAAIWVNVLERDSWILVNVDSRKLGVILTVPESGRDYLKVAGYHLGETRFVGERQNILSVRVEPISKTRHAEMLTKIREALPNELQELPVMFL